MIHFHGNSHTSEQMGSGPCVWAASTLRGLVGWAEARTWRAWPITQPVLQHYGRSSPLTYADRGIKPGHSLAHPVVPADSTAPATHFKKKNNSFDFGISRRDSQVLVRGITWDPGGREHPPSTTRPGFQPLFSALDQERKKKGPKCLGQTLLGVQGRRPLLFSIPVQTNKTVHISTHVITRKRSPQMGSCCLPACFGTIDTHQKRGAQAFQGVGGKTSLRRDFANGVTGELDLT